jgi:hypothetical protein
LLGDYSILMLVDLQLDHYHHNISGSTVLVRTLAASDQRFRNLITTLDRTPLESARRKGLYLHRTTQHRNTKTNIHASSGIRTHNPSKQAANTAWPPGPAAIEHFIDSICIYAVSKLLS